MDGAVRVNRPKGVPTDGGEGLVEGLQADLAANEGFVGGGEGNFQN